MTSTSTRDFAHRLLAKYYLPAIQECLHDGFVVALVGNPGSGKSLLASHALPTATLIGGMQRDTVLAAEINTDIIGDDLFHVVPADFIRLRDAAMARGHRVLITGHIWNDVSPYLQGLAEDRYRVLDLNSVWSCPTYQPIPEVVLFDPVMVAQA